MSMRRPGWLIRPGCLFLLAASLFFFCPLSAFCQGTTTQEGSLPLPPLPPGIPLPDFSNLGLPNPPVPGLPNLGNALLPIPGLSNFSNPYGIFGNQSDSQVLSLYAPHLGIHNPYQAGSYAFNFWKHRMEWAKLNPEKAWFLPRRPDGTVIFEGEKDVISDSMEEDVPIKVMLKTNLSNPGPLNSLNQLQHLQEPAESVQDGEEFLNRRQIPLKRMQQDYGLSR